MDLDKDELPGVKLKLTESLPCSLECVKQLIYSPVSWNHPHRKILDPLPTCCGVTRDKLVWCGFGIKAKPLYCA